MNMATKTELDRLLALGFDKSKRGGADCPNTISVKCSQCNASVINGLGVHERGCPNEVHECKGCNELVPMNVKYCADCNG